MLYTPSGNDDETGALQGADRTSIWFVLGVGAGGLGGHLGQVIDGVHTVFFGFTAANGLATDARFVTSAIPAPVPLPPALWLLESTLGESVSCAAVPAAA